LSNLFAGVSIVMDAPYKTGDFIILDAGERGVVTHIGLRSTRLLTRDDVEITIPNGIIGNSKIINEAGGPSEKHRIRIAVGAAYGSDIDHVCGTLEMVANDNPEVCSDPAPRVRFRQFGESSLDFELLCWIERPVDRGRLRHELGCAVYKGFAAANIEIPFPQRDLHVRTMPDKA
jgi:small-conductance mechanosensitive channel